MFTAKFFAGLWCGVVLACAWYDFMGWFNRT